MMMKKTLFLSVLLWLVLPAVALAADPAAELAATRQQTDTLTLPYTFEIIEYDRAGPELPQINFIDTALISQIGSIALTFFEIINLEIIGIFLVLTLSVLAMFWLYRFVTDQPTAGVAIKTPDIGVGADEAVNIAYGAANAQIGYEERAYGRQLNGTVQAMIAEGRDPDSAYAWGDDQMQYKRLSSSSRRDRLTSYRNYYRKGSSSLKRLRR